MAIRIVSEVAPISARRRLGRSLLALVGNLLLVAGLVLGAVPIMVALLSLVLMKNPAELDLQKWGQLLIFVTGAVLCLSTGLRIKRGRRRLVLFLRRFGFSRSSEMLSYAVGTAVGRRFRLVTLDDHELAAIGPKKGTQRVVKGVLWVSSILLAAGLVYAIHWFHGGEADAMLRDLFSELFDAIQTQATERGDNPFMAIFVAFFGTLIMGLLLGVVMLSLFLVFTFVPLALVTSANLFALGAARSVRRAERAKQLTITDETAMDEAVTEVVHRSRRILAPRLVVVRCADAVWQSVVRRFIAASQVVLIDVSQPSEHVLWEVETVIASGAQGVFVGQYEYVEPLASGQVPEDADTRHARRLRELLDNAEVLAYRDDDRRSMRRFSRALAACFERVLRRDDDSDCSL